MAPSHHLDRPAQRAHRARHQAAVRPNAFALHIQNPKVPARLFDLIAAPVHDGFEAPNVITTFGAVHSVTDTRLAEAAKSFAPRVEALPHPRVAVLLGGESQAFSFPA